MSRRRSTHKRDIIPDARFSDVSLAKFINCIMYQGKKSVAERIVYKALEKIDGSNGKSSIELFKDAIQNIRPFLEVRSRRVGGSTYQVPVEVAPNRAQALTFRWLITASRKRAEKTMIDRLANELLDASNNRGTTIKKREDTHKMAEANRAFAHYRW
jgi:small subunit ribosomal protein S7